VARVSDVAQPPPVKKTLSPSMIQDILPEGGSLTLLDEWFVASFVEPIG
jgi:hypothetical protein